MKQNFGNSRLVLIEEDEHKYICCCGARAWTFVVAIFSMIGCILLNINDFIALGNGHGPLHAASTDFDAPILWVSLVGSCIVFIFSVILFAGALKRKPALLLVWLIAQGIQIAITAVGVIAFIIGSIVFVQHADGVLVYIILIVGFLILGGCVFCFWVVAICRREMLLTEKNSNTHSKAVLPNTQFTNVQMGYKF